MAIVVSRLKLTLLAAIISSLHFSPSPMLGMEKNLMSLPHIDEASTISGRNYLLSQYQPPPDTGGPPEGGASGSRT